MRWVAILATLVLLVATALGGLAYYGHRQAIELFKGFSQDEIFFTVSPGETSSSISRALESKGIIKDARIFLIALWLRGATERLQAGEYRFAEPASTVDVIDRLVRGDVYYLTVTIPEGLTLAETAALLEEKGLGRYEDLRRAFERPDLVASLDPEATELEGYLYPETYPLPRKPRAEDIARAMVSQFESVFDAARREKAEELGLTVREVVTFASIVEKETGLAEERPLIASVFWNRMRRGIALQSDPTIIYDMKRSGEFDGNLRRSDLERESPYNTYLHRGLPPGPIASPGHGAIDAVLYPTQTQYLYFVSKNDGSHHFSKTLREHAAAVRKYQIEYFRNLRRRRKQGP
jgi:UPF0755 protein